jgi:hypothetical protein
MDVNVDEPFALVFTDLLCHKAKFLCVNPSG